MLCWFQVYNKVIYIYIYIYVYIHIHTHIWGREWQPTPVFLPGEFHEQRSIVGYRPWSHKESDMTEQLAQTYIYIYILFHKFASYICGSISVLYVLVRSSLGPCMLLCMAYFHSSLCLSSIPLSVGIFFIHSSVDGPLRCSRVLPVVNSAALNTGVHVPF